MSSSEVELTLVCTSLFSSLFKHKMMTMIMIMTIANAMHPLIIPYISLSVRSVHAPVLGPINVAVVV